jgi:N-acyl-L-homoserine lactone synthetase
MILSIEPHEHVKYSELLHDMFVARKEVFCDRLGWNVTLRGGEERDRYDDMDSLYILAVDAQRKAALGSLRLLPTTGPTMLKDIFQPVSTVPLMCRAR